MSSCLSRGLCVLFVLGALFGVATPSFASGCEVPPEAATLRPGAGSGPTEVEVGFFVLDIESIDDAKQQFQGDLVARGVWHDPRLGAVAAAHGAPCTFGLEEVWHPFIQVLNRRQVRTRIPPHVTVEPSGETSVVQRFYGSFGSVLDLRDFPFDVQEISFSLISFLDQDQVVVVAPESESGRDEDFTVAGWRVVGDRVTTSTYTARFGQDDVRPKARADYTLTVERDVRYYRWKVVLPLLLIVCMSWSVFFIDPSQMGPQLGAASTSILTLIAFLFSLRGILPPISYLTNMDFFVYASLALVFTAYIEALLTTSLATRDRRDLALKIDRVARVLMPSLFAVIVGLFLLG